MANKLPFYQNWNQILKIDFSSNNFFYQALNHPPLMPRLTRPRFTGITAIVLYVVRVSTGLLRCHSSFLVMEQIKLAL